MPPNFFVDPDISKAETLPAEFYRDQSTFELLKTKVFDQSWQWIGDDQLLTPENDLYPFSLLDGYLDEPMVLVRDYDRTRCLSNVCTHRANILVHHPKKSKKITCMYHGRRFGLDGKFEHMPEFQEVQNFPRDCDHLHEFAIKKWGPFLFTAIDPAFDFDQVIDVMNDRVGFLPLHEFRFDANRSKDYLVQAHWALYCDNYLEGFHIPFVHEDLNKVLDYGSYSTVLFDHINLQIGYGKGGDEVFDLPSGHPDAGKSVAAYYFWVFPNMMFNFYPWGLSINIVKPVSSNRTRVSFLTYLYDETKLEKGAGALLDKVEREDEFVVEGVFKGLQSRHYTTGRFSATREKGVHHFHRLLAEFIK